MKRTERPVGLMWPFRKAANVPEAQPAPAPIGATFGPWADHNPRCKCNVCR